MLRKSLVRAGSAAVFLACPTVGYAGVQIFDKDPQAAAQVLMTKPVPGSEIPPGWPVPVREQQQFGNARRVTLTFGGPYPLGVMRFDIFRNDDEAKAKLPGDERDQVFDARRAQVDISIGGAQGWCVAYESRDGRRHAAHCFVRNGATIISGLTVRAATADPFSPGGAMAIAKQLVQGAYNFRTSAFTVLSGPGVLHFDDGLTIYSLPSPK